MKYICCANGRQAIADDLPPSTRAIAFLLEHANRRRDEGLPLPCVCGECERHRTTIRCTLLEDGTLAVDLA